MGNQDMDQLRKWSGANKTERIKYEVPTIKFSGRDGTIQKFELGDYKNGTPIVEPEMVILRARRVYSSFTPTARMFSNEHNAYRDHITLWGTDNQKNFSKVAEGQIEDLRKDYPDLELRKALYVLYEGEVFKFTVRGKTRRHYDEYLKTLKKEKIDIFSKNTKITAVKETNPAGLSYYALQFEAVSDADLNDVAPKLQEVGENMDAIDEQYNSYLTPATNAPVTPVAPAQFTGAVSTPDIDVIEIDENGDEKKMDNIPW